MIRKPILGPFYTPDFRHLLEIGRQRTVAFSFIPGLFPLFSFDFPLFLWVSSSRTSSTDVLLKMCMALTVSHFSNCFTHFESHLCAFWDNAIFENQRVSISFWTLSSGTSTTIIFLSRLISSQYLQSPNFTYHDLQLYPWVYIFLRNFVFRILPPSQSRKFSVSQPDNVMNFTLLVAKLQTSPCLNPRLICLVFRSSDLEAGLRPLDDALPGIPVQVDCQSGRQGQGCRREEEQWTGDGLGEKCKWKGGREREQTQDQWKQWKGGVQVEVQDFERIVKHAIHLVYLNKL